MELYDWKQLYQIKFSLAEPANTNYAALPEPRDMASISKNLSYINVLGNEAVEFLRLCHMEMSTFAQPCIDGLQRITEVVDAFVITYRRNPLKYENDPRTLTLKGTLWGKTRLDWAEYQMILASCTEQLELMATNIMVIRDSLNVMSADPEDPMYQQVVREARTDMRDLYRKIAGMYKRVMHECVNAESVRTHAVNRYWYFFYASHRLV